MANRIEEEVTRFSDPNDFKSQINEFIKAKNAIEILDSRSKELREKLFAHLDLEGEEDDKGNLFYELDSPIDGIVRLEKQRRVSRKLNEELAMSLVEELKLNCVKVVYQIDEEALMAAYYEGKITEEQLDSMFPSKVTWALMTKKS